MDALKAVFLNCTLKRSPEISNTEALINKVIEWFDALGVQSEVIRVVDYNVPEGVTSDEGEGDEWPQILAKLKAADIIV
ncbi:MAG: NAD(P)H-dependent oxidoreductase, partial [Actinomycetota bacterium]